MEFGDFLNKAFEKVIESFKIMDDTDNRIIDHIFHIYKLITFQFILIILLTIKPVTGFVVSRLPSLNPIFVQIIYPAFLVAISLYVQSRAQSRQLRQQSLYLKQQSDATNALNELVDAIRNTKK